MKRFVISAVLFSLCLPLALRAQFSKEDHAAAERMISGTFSQQAAVSQETSNVMAQPAPSSPPAGKALIYVYRPGSAIGAANHPMIFVNDVFLTSLHSSEYSSREVPAGTVVFSYLPKSTVTLTVIQMLQNMVTKPTEVLRTEVEAGKTYYFKWSYATWGSHFLKLEGEATGAREMKKVHLAEDGKLSSIGGAGARNIDAKGKAWLDAHKDAPEIDVNGEWYQHTWGTVRLRQEASTGELVGRSADYDMIGVVSGKKAYLIFADKGVTNYSAVVSLEGGNRLEGKYESGIMRDESKGRSISLVKR